MKGYYVQRMNSGKIQVGEGRARRMIQLSEVGTPDLMAFMPQGRFRVVGLNKEPEIITTEKSHVVLLFVEVKRPGNKPTIHQEHKMAELTAYGARCIVAHSSQELEEQL